MSLSTTYAFNPGASYLSISPDHVKLPSQFAGLVRRQLQITTTITPTVTRGAQTGIPTRTDARQRPVPTTSTEPSSGDDSLFPANLSWWQILGIAIAGVVLFGVVAYIFVSRRNKAKVAARKAKEAEVEEGRKAKEDDVPRGMGMGMGGMGMGGMGMGGMGMGMGMGGMPMAWNQGGTGGGGRGRKKKKNRYDSESSESESYDDVSDGGTIKRSRRRKPRRRKEKDNRRGGGRRKDDYSSDDSISSAGSSSYYARPRKDRRKDKDRGRDRRRRDSNGRTPTSRDDFPLGLGPPTTGLPTSSTSRSLSRKGSLGKRFHDSVFSTFDSMTNKAAKLEALRNKAIEATRIEQELKLQDDLRLEEELEKSRQAKIREANEKIKQEKAREEEEGKRIPGRYRDQSLTGTARQNMIPLYPTPQPQYSKESYGSQTPLIPPVFRSRTKESPKMSIDSQSSRHPGRQQRIREILAPPSAYNSALPDVQAKQPSGSQSSKRSSSDLPYAYDGVASIISSQPPPPIDTRRPAEMEGRKKSGRKAKPPLHRQDSDQPLKSAMRAPGDRKPRRKATITEKPPTTRMITDQRSYDSGSQSDWLPKPPVIVKMRGPRKSSYGSDTGSVILAVPHPKDRPIIKKGGLAPAPPPRAKMKPRIDSVDDRPAVIDRGMSVSGAAGVGAGAGQGSSDQPGWGQWLGWKASGGIGNVDIAPPNQTDARADSAPQNEGSIPRPSVSRTDTPPMVDPHQPGKRWANRLRERK